MSWRDDYYAEALNVSLEELGVLDALTAEQRAIVAKDMAEAASMEREASGESAIPHPWKAEKAEMERKAARDVAKVDRKAELFREAYARAIGVTPERVYINNGEVLHDLR